MLVNSDTLLTVRQLQDLLKVDRISIYRMLSGGRLPGFKVGGQWRFSQQAIEGWLQANQANLGPSTPARIGSDLSPSPSVLPLSCVGAVQEVPAQALGVGVVTTATDGTALAPVANCGEFCSLVLHSVEGRRRCSESWRAPASGPERAPQPAICHAGLSYLRGRIEVEGQSVAVAHAGQYLEQSPVEGEWASRARELAADCGLDCQALLAALEHVPVLNRDREEQLSRLLRRVVQTFSEIGEERLNQDRS